MLTYSNVERSLSLTHISGVTIQTVYLIDYVSKRSNRKGIFVDLNVSVEFIVTGKSQFTKSDIFEILNKFVCNACNIWDSKIRCRVFFHYMLDLIYMCVCNLLLMEVKIRSNGYPLSMRILIMRSKFFLWNLGWDNWITLSTKL